MKARVQVIRDLRVMIDADLADLYGVPTKALNPAVKRNAGRFRPDFMFQLDAAERAEVVTNCDHLHKLKFSRARPYAFTEYGAVALANVLASTQAVEMRIYVVRMQFTRGRLHPCRCAQAAGRVGVEDGESEVVARYVQP